MLSDDLLQLFSFEPYSAQRILISILCGSIIGLERQLRGKPVGIRTASLIVLGTYLFVATSLEFGPEKADPTRVLGQVITGVGFLGAGVMMAREGAIMGVTSAASIWVLAAIGAMIAVGNLVAAVKISILVVAILYGVDLLEDKTAALSRGVHAKVRKMTQRQ